jgi:hypothetical protein
MEALNQAVDSTVQTNNTMMWVMFTLLVIAPIGLALIAIPVAVAQQRNLKCSKCGNWRHNKAKGIQTISTVKDGKATATTGRLIVCKKCKNEFIV